MRGAAQEPGLPRAEGRYDTGTSAHHHWADEGRGKAGREERAMGTRREFVRRAGAALGGAWLAGAGAAAGGGGGPAPGPGGAAPPPTGSDVGSLFPFIHSQAV